MTLAFHPLATIFPPIEGAEFDAFVENIRRHGVREKIVLWDDQVLEGRNRYRALLWLASTGELLGKGWGHREGLHLTEAELEADNVWFTQFNPEVDGDALSFVISKNLTRRHLTESQRAMVAASIATMQRGSRTDIAPIGAKSDAEAAAMLNVGERSVERAKSVQRDALPEIREAVERGDLAVSAAAEVATLSTDRQQVIVEQLRGADGRITPEAKKALAPIVKELRAERQAEKVERRAERETELAGKIRALPQKRYGVIYADPEWRFEPFSRDSGMDRAADNHYPTSPTAAIAARPVQDIAADDCALFLWATAPMLPDALEVMSAWGFTYRSHIVWNKVRLGTGYWFRNQHELLLVGTRGNVPAPAAGSQWVSLIEAVATEHSAKPDDFHELIEQYFPSLPKIELNARRVREGWDSWGLEAPDTNFEISARPDVPSAADGAAASAEGRTNPAAATDQVVTSPGDAATQTPNAHGCTASFAAPAAELPAAGASLPDPLDIPDFLRRKPAASNVVPIIDKVAS